MATIPTVVAKRILSLLITLILASLLVYLALSLVPGERAQILFGDGVGESVYAQLEGLPSYTEWMARILRFDFGQSAFGGQSVASLILERLPYSLALSLLSLLVALVFSTHIVLLALCTKSKAAKLVYNAVSLISLTLPSFIVALLLILAFSVGLGILPSGGVGTMSSWVLPVVSLSFMHSGLLMRMLHTGLVRELGEDYVLYARSRGVGEVRLILVHAMKGVMGEMATLSAQSFIGMLTGSAATEYIFSFPGLGALAASAVGRRDLNTIAALVLLGTLVSALVSALCDAAASRRGRT